LDENDPEPAGVVAGGDGTWDLPGTLRLDEVERATKLSLPESDDYDTIAGLVLAALGRMAEPGDRVTVTLTLENDPFENDAADEADAVLTVLSVHRRVPEWVRLAPAALEEAVPENEEEDEPAMTAPRMIERGPGTPMIERSAMERR
jgi:CBS domain containing-hemolysin-like protein